MSDQDLGAFSEGCAGWRRVLASVPQEERVRVFHNVAAEIASYVSRGLARATAADELADMATASGLMDDDQVQAIIGGAFALVRDADAIPDDLETPYTNGRDHGPHEDTPEEKRAKLLLPAFRASLLAGTSAPARRWSVQDRIPMRNVTLLQGDGATGKTTIALQLAVVCVSGGNDWLGAMIEERGPVLFLTAEEERDEVHYRLEKIAAHYKVELSALEDLHIVCAAGDDCVVGAINPKKGQFEPLAFYERLRVTVDEIKPKLVILESSADLYGGNENDRASVRQFIRLLRAIAIEFDCAVLLLSHPSAAGLATGSGTSGTTGWNNAVRSRMYFTRARDKDEDGADDEQDDRRVLKIMKANYAPRGDSVNLVYDDGVFAQPRAKTEAERAKHEQEIEAVFFQILRKITERGGTVSPNISNAYAPTIFADQPEAKARRPRVTKDQLVGAMERLLRVKKIEARQVGPQSRRSWIIVECNPIPGALNYGARPSDDGADARIIPFGRGASEGQKMLDRPKASEPQQSSGSDVFGRPIVQRTPPITPHSPGGMDIGVEGSDGGGSLRGDPTVQTSTPQLQPAKPKQESDRFRVIGDCAPETVCLVCQKADGLVKRIKDTRAVGSKSETLHERCAGQFFRD